MDKLIPTKYVKVIINLFRNKKLDQGILRISLENSEPKLRIGIH
jgi:hypothetical protein